MLDCICSTVSSSAEFSWVAHHNFYGFKIFRFFFTSDQTNKATSQDSIPSNKQFQILRFQVLEKILHRFVTYQFRSHKARDGDSIPGYKHFKISHFQNTDSS
jgi:hypothetical protein